MSRVHGNIAMKKVWSIGTMLVLRCLVLSACVGRPSESKQFRAITPAEGVSLNNPFASQEVVAAAASTDGVHNVLALSGGGAYGAYGVGYLSGWTAT